MGGQGHPGSGESKHENAPAGWKKHTKETCKYYYTDDTKAAEDTKKGGHGWRFPSKHYIIQGSSSQRFLT